VKQPRSRARRCRSSRSIRVRRGDETPAPGGSVGGSASIPCSGPRAVHGSRCHAGLSARGDAEPFTSTCTDAPRDDRSPRPAASDPRVPPPAGSSSP
jgi:hypothetical protein